MLRKTSLAAIMLLLLLYSQLSTQAWAAKKITLDFVDVELATFTKFVSDTTGRNFVFDDRLKGKVTVITPTGLSKEETFKLFTSVLNLKGFTLQPVGGNVYKIIPVSEARQIGLPVMTTQANENYMIRLIPLQYISAPEAVRFLSPVVSRDGYIASFDQGNYLLVIDSALNIDKLMGILDVIDTAPIAQRSEIVFLKNARAEDVARILNEGLPRKTPSGPPHAIAEPRLNAVVLIGDKAEKEAMKRLMTMLDVPTKLVLSGIHVYFLEHANAEDLAKTLQGLIGQQGKGTAVPVAAASTQEKIKITPDKGTNALVISASQADYQDLLPVIKKLDRARSQVFVQAMIVEASLSDLTQLGAEWRATVMKGGQPIFIGGVGTIDSTAVQNIISGLSGLSMGGLGNILNIPVTTVNGVPQTLTLPGFAALFDSSQFKDAVHVMSTPQIYTSDNQEAEILVGQNVPFPTGSQTAVGTTATAGLITTVERQDVGIKLKITPHITEGDVVRLDIYQEISSVVQPTVSGTNLVSLLSSVGPTIDKRSTKTSVFVNDGQTIVIGGLMSENDEDSVTKVPLLGDIPILGYLFKHRSVSRQKTNLLVFISPIVIKTPSDIGKVTEEKTELFGRKTSTYEKGELVVKFKYGTTDEQARRILGRKGLEVLKLMGGNTYLVKLRQGQGVMDTARQLGEIPEVRYAKPKYAAAPADPEDMQTPEDMQMNIPR